MEAFCKTCDSVQEVELATEAAEPNTVFCLACGEEFVKSNGGADIYNNFQVAKVLKVEPIAKQKDLKKILVDITGDEDVNTAIQIVTNAKYIEENWLVVVALENAIVPAGAVLGDDPEAVQVKPCSVGGVKSHGMVCDSPMLNWTGGAKGVVQQLPESDESGTVLFKVGDKPPSARPQQKK